MSSFFRTAVPFSVSRELPDCYPTLHFAAFPQTRFMLWCPRHFFSVCLPTITRWSINWKRCRSHTGSSCAAAFPHTLSPNKSVMRKSGLHKFGHGQLSDIGSSTQRSNISICLELLITQQQLSSTKKTSLRCRGRTGR